MTTNKNKDEESTALFIVCIGILLAAGFLSRFTDVLGHLPTWLIYVLFVAGPFGWLILMAAPYIYIKAKLMSWGVREDKADSVTAGFWFTCVIVWYFAFIFDPSK